MNEVILDVEGMHCSGCENRIKNVVGSISGVKEVLADHETGKVIVRFEGELDLGNVRDRLVDLGFEVLSDK